MSSFSWRSWTTCLTTSEALYPAVSSVQPPELHHAAGSTCTGSLPAFRSDLLPQIFVVQQTVNASFGLLGRLGSRHTLALTAHISTDRPLISVGKHSPFVLPLYKWSKSGTCRVWRRSPDSDWQETWVQPAEPAPGLQTPNPKEVMKPVSDPLIWACLAAAQDLRQDQPSSSWLHATMDWVLASGHLPPCNPHRPNQQRSSYASSALPSHQSLLLCADGRQS